ncbi:[Pyruvate dehydrogenase (acetyl-transferring)] kinase 1, mitochondrial [Candida viswanathii]|uniref:Protein-serine/threonine kinase n=1 Tax=Candida viswanathii TaxID=5486 RepID=A0A367YK79_9ASCO|nr:[Pyruvate dehydrogenase (acetyl-transferring)] kinase 1, mitochondrial [Candida viswanathii]
MILLPRTTFRRCGSILRILVARNISTSHEPQECHPQQLKFLEEYKVRTMLEQPIIYYSSKKLPQFSMEELYLQLTRLSQHFILQNARDTIEHLLIYNCRRLKEFRKLPYLVVLNPSILESYDIYLQTMSSLLKASTYMPHTLDENTRFAEEVLTEFIDAHADTLPSLSKGFTEVSSLMNTKKITDFLDQHLKERISMRLIAHQHIELTRTLNDPLKFVKGGKYNGVIKMLHIPNIIKKNAVVVNDITMMKYNEAVEVAIDTNLYPLNYWSQCEPELKEKSPEEMLNFPYIEYHLDYILMEIFKNSFRAHIENKITDPVQVTISTSYSPEKYLEIRVRDKGKGIPTTTLKHIFDYSFSTYESGEGDSYKTLNVPPGLGGNTVAGMGFGLPLAKQYIEVFNETIDKDKYGDDGGVGAAAMKGLLTVQTYPGWGTDVYVKTVGY